MSHLKRSISTSDLRKDIGNFALELYAERPSSNNLWLEVECLKQFADVLKKSVCVLYLCFMVNFPLNKICRTTKICIPVFVNALSSSSPMLLNIVPLQRNSSSSAHFFLFCHPTTWSPPQDNCGTSYFLLGQKNLISFGTLYGRSYAVKSLTWTLWIQSGTTPLTS